jgi:type I restriction enzyme, S subunit
VFSYETRIGQAALIPDGLRCCLGRRLALARPKSNAVNSQYLLYYFLAPPFQRHLRAHTKPGSTVDRIHLKDFPKFPIVLPPRSYQDSVANLLSALDEKIEVNRRMAVTLEQLARALFKSWFVDFDPVRAKTEGRQPALPPATAALFPDRFGDKGLPVGWDLIKIADGCRAIFSGGTPSTSEPGFWNGSLPWLSSGETRNHFITDTKKRITQQAIDNSSTRLARKGSTVIASAGQGNTRGQTSLLLLDTHINQSVIALQANVAVSSDLFLFFDLERRYDEFRQVSDGQSSRGSLTTKLIGGLPAICPERNVVAAFDLVVQPLVDRIEGALEQAEGLRAMRDNLLAKLISGELRINDAKNEVKVA